MCTSDNFFYCDHCEVVAGKQIIIRCSLEHSDIVKTHFDSLKYHQVDILNVGQSGEIWTFHNTFIVVYVM